MSVATDLMSKYAAYHRDRRNIATHFVGIPLIVFAVGALLSRPVFVLGGLALSPAWLVFALVAAWYLTRGELLLGLVTSMGIALLLGWRSGSVRRPCSPGWSAVPCCCCPGSWCSWSATTTRGGGRPLPTNPSGLLVGPMFVALEVLSAIGLCQRLAREVERHAGPTLLRDLAHPA
jgi:uncharacterized membrane protein YGL010W